MSFNMRQKSNLLFGQLVSFGSLLTIIFFIAFYKIYNFVFSAFGEIVARQASVACGCQVASPPNNYTFLGMVSFLGFAILATFIFGFIKIIITLVKTKNFLRIQKTSLIETSQKLTQVSMYIGIQDKVVEIDDPRPLIFCHGFKNSRIYISSAVVNALSYAELQATLLHETHHLLDHEPARLLFIKFLSAFAFVPGIKNLSKKYLSFSEIAADEMATNSFKEKNSLASAMAKILEMEENNIIQNELALSYFSQITEDRVLVLSNNNYKPGFKKETIKIMLSLVAVLVVLLFLGTNLERQQARAQEIYTTSGCANKITMEKCKNAWTGCAGEIYHKDKITCKKGDKSYLQE
jgi:beta-lactamase regulating signal transducer with metallopeptidase domain